MNFTIGLLALAVGLAFDMQRLFPKLGDRIAAVCALTVGAAWFAGGQVGSWVNRTTDTTTAAVGQAGHELTTDVPSSSGKLILGVAVGFFFLIWVLAMLPGLSLITTHVSPNAQSPLTSGLIWSGVLLPPLVAFIPGWWGDIAHSVTFAGANLGAQLSGLVLS